MVDVIGAGLGRTGTLSLKAALEILGFTPCWHIEDMAPGVSLSSGQLDLWHRLAQGEQIDWQALFAGYRATTDAPACMFYREQLEAFPEARVVLTKRDPLSWAASTAALRVHFDQLSSEPRMAAGPGRMWRETMHRLYWDRLGDVRDQDALVATFNAHLEAVIRDVPRNRLLVFDVREGWEPLCDFLGTPVPETTFPRLNERAALKS